MLSALAEVVFPATCPGCGARAEPLCAACARTVRPAPPGSVPRGLDDLVVPFAYTGVVRELVARAKYRRRHAALAWLGAVMAEALVDAYDVDVVTWAPTTAARRHARGFDQAEVLARGIARVVGRPARGLLRRVGSGHQTGHSRVERIETPAFAPSVCGPLRTPRVLLVDDVVTTGTTLSTAAGVVRDLGAIRVVGVAAARRP
jgi:predicted amidophosphoribosyltransferase